MIIAALFTIVRKWKQCLCPLLDDEQTKCGLDVEQNKVSIKKEGNSDISYDVDEP